MTPITWCEASAAISLFPGDMGRQGYSSMILVDKTTLGVLYEANKHIYFQHIVISAYVD